jgi:hypothetical protein
MSNPCNVPRMKLIGALQFGKQSQHNSERQRSINLFSMKQALLRENYGNYDGHMDFRKAVYSN